MDAQNMDILGPIHKSPAANPADVVLGCGSNEGILSQRISSVQPVMHSI